MKKLSYILIITFLLSACGSSSTPAPVPTTAPPSPVPPTATTEVLPTVTPACVSSEPTQTDIDRALGYTGNIFSAPVWEQSYETYENKVAVYWVSADGVVFLENVIFPCGYEEPDLNNYFSDEHWDIVFGNYESYVLENECRNDRGLRLCEFSIADQGTDYDVNYWSTYDSTNTIITVMLLLPAEADPVLDEYSAMLFSQLPYCE